MRITAVEAIPYALPFRRPTSPPAGRLERREMVLVRLRTDEGVEGLGEAVPLSLRGGASLRDRRPRGPRAWRAGARRARLAEPRSGGAPLAGAVSPRPRRRSRWRCLDLAAKLAGMPAVAAARARVCRAGASATRPWSPGRPTAVAAERRALGGARLRDLQAQGRECRATSARWRPCARPSGREARIRVDANGVWSPQEAVLRLTRDGAPRDRARRAARRGPRGAGRGAQPDRDPDRGRRERRDAGGRRGGRRARRLPAGDREARQGGRRRPGARDRRRGCPSTSRAPSTGRSGSPRRPTRPRSLRDDGAGGGPGPRARDPAPVRGHDRLGGVRAA